MGEFWRQSIFPSPLHYICDVHFADLQLTHFRNYASLQARFSPAINALTGNNGAGKTNVLEAIHFLAMTRGFQPRREAFALQEGMPYFTVEGQLQQGELRQRVQCSYMPPKGKKMLIDRQGIGKMSDHIGSVPLIAILPGDTNLIHGTPSVRRRFVDAFSSQHDRNYLEALQRYEKARAQRNALLSLFHERRTWDEGQLLLWDEQLIPPGIYLHQAREAFLEAFLPRFLRFFKMIVSERESPEILLEGDVRDNDPEGWRAGFAASRQRDRHSQRTNFGVHREDLAFSINGQEVKHFGSQGQQRTFVIALLLAQYELLAELTHKAPILLLDDIFDKLDIHRLRSIAQILHQEVKGQVFITDTSSKRTRGVFSEFSDREVRYFEVEDGKLKAAEAG